MLLGLAAMKTTKSTTTVTAMAAETMANHGRLMHLARQRHLLLNIHNEVHPLFLSVAVFFRVIPGRNSRAWSRQSVDEVAIVWRAAGASGTAEAVEGVVGTAGLLQLQMLMGTSCTDWPAVGAFNQTVDWRWARITPLYICDYDVLLINATADTWCGRAE